MRVTSDHVDHQLPMRCPWCDAPFTYSWWHGGGTCKTCGKPTGKARLERGNVKNVIYKESPGTFKLGDADASGFIPIFRHSGWSFRCNVTTGSLMDFLKRCAMLGNYIPITVTSMSVDKKRTRWDWQACVTLPVTAKPFDMPGVTWHNEMTIRPQCSGMHGPGDVDGQKSVIDGLRDDVASRSAWVARLEAAMASCSCDRWKSCARHATGKCRICDGVTYYVEKSEGVTRDGHENHDSKAG